MLACLAVLALLLTGASVFAYRSAEQRKAAEEVQDRTQALLSSSADLKVAILNANRGERGYVITQNPKFLEPYTAAQPLIANELSRLGTLTGSDPKGTEHLRDIESQLAELAGWQREVISLQSTGAHDEAIALITAGGGRRLIEGLLDEIAHLELHAHVSLSSSANQTEILARNNELYQYGLTLVGLMLLVVTSFATVAIRRSIRAEAEVREELHRRAITDDLTGLANRRELMASLDRAIAAARRSRRPLALAVLDIDHFKHINDSHGHPAGDAVIRRIAMLAVDVMRGQDTVGRLGGEEFAVILPDCAAEDAMAACERLRLAVRDTDLEMETGHPIFITLSTGIAVFERHDCAEAMIARADAALYAAKHGGRDQVRLAA